MLVGLKSDLRNKKTCIDLLKTQGLTPVTPEQGRVVAQKMDATYMECSSKETTGVEEIFEAAIDMAVKPDLASSGPNSTSDPVSGIRKKKRTCKIF
jgi:Ras homolog gene family, member A